MGQSVYRMWRRPGLVIPVIMILSVGVGAGAVASSILSQVLLEPLPYHEPDRIALVRVDRPDNPDQPLLTGAEYAAVEGAESIRSAAVVVAGMNLRMDTDDGSESVVAAGVGVDLFGVLGVRPALGRGFREEDLAGGNAVLVTWQLWRDRLGGTRDVIGRRITLGGRVHTVIGVLPRGFDLFVGRDARGAEDASVFLPAPVARNDTRFAAFRTVVRLADGADYATAEEELSVAVPRLARAISGGGDGRPPEYRLVPLDVDEVADARPAIVALVVAAGLVVLLTSMNAAGLLVVRATRRRREHAIRAALGASRRRLVLEALTEAAVLTLAATVIGMAGGTLLLQLLITHVPVQIPRMDSVELGARAIGLSALLVTLVTMVTGLMSALHAARVDPQSSLRASGGRGVSSPGARRGLVVGQIAGSLVLLLGSGLMVRTLANLRAVSLGFDTENLYVAKVVAPRPEPGAPYWPFFQEAVRRLESLPGIAGATAVSRTPLAEQSDVDIVPFAGQPGTDAGDAQRADLRWVLPNAFDVMGIPLREGRSFTAQELDQGRPVVVIDERIAARLWPGRSAVGQEILVPRRFGGDPEPAVIVGVATHQRLVSPRVDGRPQVFRPASHMAWGLMTVAVRSDLPRSDVFRSVRTVASELNATNVYALATMDRIVDEATAGTTVATVTVASLGVAASLSALLGLYSLLAFHVAGRRREIGVRLAMGATSGELVRSFAAAGMRLTTIGLVVGCVIALLLSGIVEASLFGIGARDPRTWTTVCLLFLGTAGLATYGPARNAATVDPVEAIRSE